MTTEQKSTAFSLISQILTAAKATENKKFAVHTFFSLNYSVDTDKEMFNVIVIPMIKNDRGEVIKDENGIGVSYDGEECPIVRLRVANSYEILMEKLTEVAKKFGLVY